MPSELEDRLADTTSRFTARADQRGENERRTRAGGPLAAEAPPRAAARALRLTERLGAARVAGGAAAELAELGLERVLGADDLMSVSFLEGGFLSARSVARIKIKSAGGAVLGFGTGFLVSPRILLTNHHVLGTASVALPSSAEFDFRDTARGSSARPCEFRLRPDLFFRANRELDASFVAVEPFNLDGSTSLSTYGWNRLIADEGKIAVGEMLNIIQHPGGQPQQVALRANELRDVLENHLHYVTDTAPGSSGSPVFNDQWEIVALHHSGVPKRDAQGRILADDGTPWRKEMGEHRVAWVANEGVRISRILAWLRGESFDGPPAELRAEVLDPPIPERSLATFPFADTPMNPIHTATLNIPLTITISVTASQPALSQPMAAPAEPVKPQEPVKPPVAPGNAALQADFAGALAQLRAAESEEYFDATRDVEDQGTFYGQFDWTRSPEEIFNSLAKLLRETHHTKPRYKPMTEVYPKIDRHPDGKIRSIYSGIAYSAEEFLRLDLEVEAARQAKLTGILARESLTPDALTLELETLEDSLPYNCEHVVPQSWFNKREPMRGDLHHLFACESGCNSFRGNTPYFDFDEAQEVVRNECGRREDGKFEPEAGHGAVARATLYFLLRYPRLIGDEARELAAARLPLLLQWHHDEPPGEYEKHRNQIIFARQGNRNPLIDFPNRADRIGFAAGFGTL